MDIIVLTACNKSAVEDLTPETYIYTIQADLIMDSLDEETRSGYTDAGAFTWSDNDEISVLFHNDETHQFFTFRTTTGGSNTATFTGTVTSGYSIGASSKEGGKCWALYPADVNHEWDFTNSVPAFNMPAVRDFSSTPTQANLFMCAKSDSGDGFSFVPIAGCYKFTFTDVPVNKVKLELTHTDNAYWMSGKSSLLEGLQLDFYPINGVGTGSKTVTLINSVNPSTKTVSFYVPYRCWQTPVMTFTLINDDDSSPYKGATLLKGTGKAALPSTSSCKLILLKPISAPSDGSPYGIDWSKVSTSTAGTGAISVMKVKAESRYIYVYLEIPTSGIYNEDSYGYSNRSYLYVADGSTGSHSNDWTQDDNINYEGWLKQYNVPKYTINNSGKGVVNDKPGFIGESNGILYIELALDRSNASLACLQNASTETRYFGFYVTGAYKVGAGSTVYGDKTGFAPASGGSMLAVSVPGYVAP